MAVEVLSRGHEVAKRGLGEADLTAWWGFSQVLIPYSSGVCFVTRSRMVQGGFRSFESSSRKMLDAGKRTSGTCG